jgi:hypothetical protein
VDAICGFYADKEAIWNSGNGRVSAVASRVLQRSRRFIDLCQAHAPFNTAPRAYGSYEQLLSDPEVDAVYFPLPTAVRGHWVKQAAAAGGFGSTAIAIRRPRKVGSSATSLTRSDPGRLIHCGRKWP